MWRDENKPGIKGKMKKKKTPGEIELSNRGKKSSLGMQTIAKNVFNTE